MSPALSRLPISPASRSWTSRTRNRILSHRAALTESWLRATFPAAQPEALPETPVEKLLEIAGGRPSGLQAPSGEVQWNTVRINAEESSLRRLNRSFSAAIVALATCLCLVVILT